VDCVLIVVTTGNAKLRRSVGVYVRHDRILAVGTGDASLLVVDTTIVAVDDVKKPFVAIDDFRGAVAVKVEQRTTGVSGGFLIHEPRTPGQRLHGFIQRVQVFS